MPYKDKENQAEYQREWANTRTAARHKAGLCVQCGEKAFGRWRCKRCQRRHRLWDKVKARKEAMKPSEEVEIAKHAEVASEAVARFGKKR